MAKKIEQTKPTKNKTINETIKYALKRYLSIFPYLFFGTLFGLIVHYLCFNWGSQLNSYLNLLGDFLLLQSLGLPVASITGIIWYLSSMIIGILIVYPITKKYYEYISKYLGLIIAIILISILTINFGKISVPDEYLYGFICSGNLRSIAMMFLGVWIYDKSKLLINIKTRKKQVCLKIFSILLYMSAIALMLIWNDTLASYEYVIILLLAGALTITIGQTCNYCKIMSNTCRNLGKYSVALLVSHFYFVQYMGIILFELHISVTSDVSKYIGIISSILCAIIVCALANIVMNLSVYKKIIDKLNY